jgi:hypothetical protein
MSDSFDLYLYSLALASHPLDVSFFSPHYTENMILPTSILSLFGRPVPSHISLHEDKNEADSRKLMGASSTAADSGDEVQTRHLRPPKHTTTWDSVATSLLIFVLILTNGWWYLARSRDQSYDMLQEINYCM